MALDPIVGTEIGKTRPGVVVSNDACNAFGKRVVVLPVTGTVENVYPGEARITVRGRPARALGDQVRAVDRRRLTSRIAVLSREEAAAVEEALRITLDL